MQTEHSYRYFFNASCQFYPCHKGADTAAFNCLFCFCPLYGLGDKCGGDFNYIHIEKRAPIKDCAGCRLPHDPVYYDTVIAKLVAAAQEKV